MNRPKMLRRRPGPTWYAAAADRLAAELEPGDVITSVSIQAESPDGQRMLYALSTVDGDVHRYVYSQDEDVMALAAAVMDQALIEVGEGL